MASWNNQPQQPTSGGRPTANPLGGSLTKDDIQLKRLGQKASDPSTLIKNAFEFIKLHPLETAVLPIGLFFMLIVAQWIIGIPLNMIASIIGSALGNAMGGDAGQFVAVGISISASMVIQLISSIFMVALLGGINILWLRVIRGQSVTVNDMFAIKSFVIPLIIAGIVTQIVVTVGVFFLIVPGIILALGFSMAQYIVIDKNLGSIDALKASWELTNGRKMELLIFAIILIVFNFVGFLACVVGMILTYAISLGAMASYYDAIAEPGNAYGSNLGNVPDVFS